MELYYSEIAFSPLIEITVISNYTVYTQISVSFLILDLYGFEPNLAAYQVYSDFITPPAGPFSLNFGAPSDFGSAALGGNCMIGLNLFDIIPSSQSYVYFTFSSQDITSVVYSAT